MTRIKENIHQSKSENCLGEERVSDEVNSDILKNLPNKTDTGNTTWGRGLPLFFYKTEIYCLALPHMALAFRLQLRDAVLIDL